MEESVKQRLTQFIKFKGLNAKRFEEMTGLSNGYLSKLTHAPGADKLRVILETFPDLNHTWLMTGEGSMLRTGINQTNLGPNGKNEVDQSVKTTDSEALMKALEEISAMRLALERSMEINQKNTDEYLKLLNRLIDKK